MNRVVANFSIFLALGLMVSHSAVAETNVLKANNIKSKDSVEVSKALADPAAAGLAKPTAGQVRWQNMECEMFVHFGVATWLGREYDSRGDFDLSKMTPSKFSASQICDAAQSWGAKQVILVCKHVGGFCWWPTNTTDYCVKNIPWKNGKGNLVKEVADELRKRGMSMGIYIYSDDTRYSKGIGRGGVTDDPAKQEEWNKKLRQQWREVLTICGPDLVREVWFDGGCKVPLKDILDEMAPNAEIFAGPYETLRWPSTESGKMPYPCWSSVAKDLQSAYGGNAAAVGDPNGKKWCPAENDTVFYGTKGTHNWFWSPKNELNRRTVDELMDIYMKSVGRGSVLLLNSSPNTTGQIPKDDMKRYAEFGAEVQRRFGNPIAKKSGVGSTVVLELGKLQKVNHYWIMEDIRGGHRIRAYSIEGRDTTGTWLPLAKGISVGHKRIEAFATKEVNALRLRITKQVGTPIIRELAAFYVGNVKAGQSVAKVAKAASCGSWAKGAKTVTLDLTPHIPVPATYSVTLQSSKKLKIVSAQLLFNGSTLPKKDCVLQGNTITVRQTQQLIPGESSTTLVLTFEPGSTKGTAKIKVISEQ
ncbi:MAG: alpha-L-fucosidase [Lentisphaeria bacterium]|nr:alpha-L-fucosidase [Lentisphaeria bacterium]